MFRVPTRLVQPGFLWSARNLKQDFEEHVLLDFGVPILRSVIESSFYWVKLYQLAVGSQVLARRMAVA